MRSSFVIVFQEKKAFGMQEWLKRAAISKMAAPVWHSIALVMKMLKAVGEEPVRASCCWRIRDFSCSGTSGWIRLGYLSSLESAKGKLLKINGLEFLVVTERNFVPESER